MTVVPIPQQVFWRWHCPSRKSMYMYISILSCEWYFINFVGKFGNLLGYAIWAAAVIYLWHHNSISLPSYLINSLAYKIKVLNGRIWELEKDFWQVCLLTWHQFKSSLLQFLFCVFPFASLTQCCGFGPPVGPWGPSLFFVLQPEVVQLSHRKQRKLSFL